MLVPASFRCAKLFRSRIAARIIRLVDIVMSIAQEQMVSCVAEIPRGGTAAFSICWLGIADCYGNSKAKRGCRGFSLLIYHAITARQPLQLMDVLARPAKISAAS